MTFAMRWLASGALVGVCMLAWGSNVGRDVVGAQGSSKPTVIKRMKRLSGPSPNGESGDPPAPSRVDAFRAPRVARFPYTEPIGRPR